MVDGIIDVLQYWQSMAEKMGLDNALPTKGLFFTHPPTLYELHVVNTGAENQLIYYNVVQAISAMLDYYKPFPLNVGTIVPLSEVLVSKGLLLKGFATLTGKDTACGQALHLDATGQRAPPASF